MSYRLPHERTGPITIEDCWSALSRNQRILCVCAVGNFLAFVIGYFLIGGDALQGQQFGGRYWVGNKGVLREVSKLVYHYSVLHMMSLIFSHPLAIALGFIAKERARRARQQPER